LGTGTTSQDPRDNYRGGGGGQAGGKALIESKTHLETEKGATKFRTQGGDLNYRRPTTISNVRGKLAVSEGGEGKIFREDFWGAKYS